MFSATFICVLCKCLNHIPRIEASDHQCDRFVSQSIMQLNEKIMLTSRKDARARRTKSITWNVRKGGPEYLQSIKLQETR